DDVVLFAQSDDLILNRFRRALFQQAVEMHSRPQPGNERVAVLGVFELDARAKAHRLVPLYTGDDHFADLVFAFRQIAAQENLLRSARNVGQLFRINAGDLHPLELDFEITQRRLRDFAQQFERDCLWSLLAADAAERATAERSNRLDGRGLETI